MTKRINQSHLSAIAYVVNAIRPTWDRAGIEAILRGLDHLELAQVAHAAIVAAATRHDQKTPALIAMSGAHWDGHDFDKPTSALRPVRQDPRDWKGAPPEVVSKYANRVREAVRNSQGPEVLPAPTHEEAS